MTTDAVRSIYRFAICSRVFLLILSFLSNHILPDHEASDVFIFKYKKGSRNLNALDQFIYTLFGGLIRWDANYFLSIASNGYTEENTLAFFPLFPCVIRVISSFLYLFVAEFVTFNALLLLFSVVVNFVVFVKCSELLYHLTLKVMKDDVIAYYSAIIFCVNPASVFFSAPYSETLFSFLTFLVMLSSFNENFLVASLVGGLSCAARSNGTLNIGFILYAFVVFFIKQFTFSTAYFITFGVLFSVFLVISIAPFYLFQLYSYIRFCLEYEHAISEDSWCNDMIPLAYSHVQSKYWNVGFLKYYELKQLPNFLLASPIIYILLTTSYKILTKDKRFLRRIFSLEIISDINSMMDNTIDRLNYFVTILHVALLTIFCICFVHIQVSTRMLCSSSPAFYWFIADCFKNNYYNSFKVHKPTNKIRSDFEKIFNRSKLNEYIGQEKSDAVYGVNITHYWRMFYTKYNTTKQTFLIFYCLGYFVIGTVLFSNFFPWT